MKPDPRIGLTRLEGIMAETVPTPPGSAMEYGEHERTYDLFLRLALLVAVQVAIILIALLMFSFGTNGGFWLGVLTIVLAIVSSAIDVSNRVRVRVSYYVLGIAVLFALLSLA